MSDTFLRFLIGMAIGWNASSAWRGRRTGDFLACFLAFGALIALAIR